MKKLMLLAVAALTLTAGIASAAQVAPRGAPPAYNYTASDGTGG
jgi:hypothetical protein